MKLNQVERVFSYNGVTLPDPGPGMSVDAVKDLYSGVHPGLLTAAVDGPVMKAGKQTFTFVKAVRDKGGKADGAWMAELVSTYRGDASKDQPGVRINLSSLSDEVMKCGQALETLFDKRQSRPTPCLVAAALPLLL